MENIRVRFAPSPTGYLHIGSLRTALFTYLIGKSLNGKIILRIEDTDEKRKVAGSEKALIKILDWLGIKFDEGPHIGGDFGPYTQTERLAIYQKYAEELLANGKAYRCFCSEDRLKAMRDEQQIKKEPPRYDRTCRNLSEKEIKKRLDKGENFVIRQAMPLGGDVIAHDELRGDIKFNAADLDDHVLVKTNGVPTYQLASIVDDHLMEITHVTRAEEWLPSFPKNILLYQAFGWKAPKFIHYPVILNKEGGGKLSKRQGDVAVEDFRGKGYLPAALINFCSLLGWHPKDDKEILSLDEIISKFKISDLGTSPAVFDIDKLDYFNGYYIRQLDSDHLTELCLPYLSDSEFNYDKKITDVIINKNNYPYIYIKKVIRLEQDRLKKLSDVKIATRFFFTDNLSYDTAMLIWKKLTKADVKENLIITQKLLEKIPFEDWTESSVKDAIMMHIQNKRLKTGDYLWPLRVALTGENASPGPFEVAEILGKKNVLLRIAEAIKIL